MLRLNMNQSKLMQNKICTLFYSTIRSDIYLIFAFLGIILLFYSIFEMKPVVVVLNDFLGLSSHLTMAYWLGYILIIILSVRLYLDEDQKKDYIYLTYLIIIGLFLFGISIFTEENARYAWSYYPSGEIKIILETSKVENIDEYPLLAYRSWPGSHFVSAYMIYMANIKLDNLIKYMPIFWILSVTLLTYSTGKIFRLPNNQCFATAIFVISSFWTMNYYYGPQSIGYILYLVFFTSMALLYRINDMANITFMILSFFTAVITHMLTSIILILSFISSSRFMQSLQKNRIKLVILFAIIFMGWHLYIAPVMFNAGVNDAIRQLTEGRLFQVFKTEKYDPGITFMRYIIHYVRMSYIGIYAILMIMATIFYLKGRIKEHNELVKICFLWLIGIAVMLIFRYGAEIDDRVYIMALLPMSLITIMTFDKRIITTLIVILAFLHIPAHYGTESYDMVYTTELQGSKFVASNIYPYSVMNYYYGPLIRYYNPYLLNTLRGSGVSQGIYNPDNKSLDISNYIVHSEQISNFLLYLYGIDKIQAWLQDNKTNLIYNNGFYSLYQNV